MLHCIASRQSPCRPSSLSWWRTSWQTSSCDDGEWVYLPKSPENPIGTQNREEVESEQPCRFCPAGFEDEGGRGYAQTKWQGFYLNDMRWWSKASTWTRRKIVLLEIRETEDERRAESNKGSGWHGKGPCKGPWLGATYRRWFPYGLVSRYDQCIISYHQQPIS